MTNIFNLPNIGYGLGLRTTHYPHILEHFPKDVDWFEIISENFMDAAGRPRTVLKQVREHYPVAMHGVSLSIGSTDSLNIDYLKRLKKLADELDPVWISDHLCWTGCAHTNTHDLLPVPYTEEALEHIVSRIKKVQEVLERPILMENPSTYLEFKDSTMSEQEFIARMANEADCALLLDVNNVYVSCFNHRYNTKDYIDELPLERVVQIHLAGHEHQGTHIIDTHDDHVIDEVWQMYKYVIANAGYEIPTMIEWDDNIPEYQALADELSKARTAAKDAVANVGSALIAQLPDFSEAKDMNCDKRDYAQALSVMQNAILTNAVSPAHPDTWIPAKKDFPPEVQLQTYANGYRYRLYNILYDNFPVLRHYLGEEKAGDIFRAYITATNSTHYNVDRYLDRFPSFVVGYSDDTLAIDITRLEEVQERLFVTSESEVLTTEALSEVTPDILLESKLKLRTSLELLQFSYPLEDYFIAIKEEKEPTIPKPKDSYMAVYRHEDVVWRLTLENTEYELLQLLNDGMLIGEALYQSGADDTQVQKWFARWMSNHLLSEIICDDSNEIKLPERKSIAID